MDERVVVFDLGMVLVSPVGLFEELGQTLGASVEDVREQYWAHRHAYDQGLADSEYWERTFPLLDLSADQVSALLPRLIEVDARGWSHLRDEARQILVELRARGEQIAVLSNMPTSLAARVQNLEWAALVDEFFFSGPMGIAKPDNAIYARVQSQLGASAEHIYFIDDKIENVEGAAAAGWHSHLWRDDADTRDWLISLGLL